MPVSGSGQFPGGNFDLERMRLTDLAAAQSPAVSLRPGLGCPCYLSTHGTPSSRHGLGGQRGAFSLSQIPLFWKSLIHGLIHSCGYFSFISLIQQALSGIKRGFCEETGRVAIFRDTLGG